jgi:predicted CXXCH cytochrome family protein
MKRMIFGLVMAWTMSASASDDSVVNSPHDLSTRGPGPIRALHETQVCNFCHTPHNAVPQTPLWNRRSPPTHYRIYESSTLDARVNQPSGPSKMCLSCHDGMLALGSVLSVPVTHPILTTPRTIPPGPTDLTSDLSDDHPIGFRYDRALALADPQIRVPELITRELPLGRHNEVHCTTCHDPHDNSEGNFLRITDRFGAICLTCHDMKGWQGSAHERSKARLRGREVDPRERLNYRTVEENACLTCHKIHGATERERLLRFQREEMNCLNCHDGSVAKTNILADIRKRSAHRVDLRTGVHDPAENSLTMRRHVECTDCHNPHAVRPDQATTNRGTRGHITPLANLYVSGVSQHGARLEASRLGYEICFKCHSENVSRRRTQTQRQVTQSNTRLEFQTSNDSYHPVLGARRNPDVVSLIPPLRQGSMITCIDCHNSDNARSAGGNGPSGPHGSIYKPLLVDNYETATFTTESARAYALCYQCHDRNSILSNESFSLHERHIVSFRTPCSTCHDAHGVRKVGSSDHTNLINFDLSIVEPVDSAAGSGIVYEDLGRQRGNCTLKCHGVNHVRFPYSPR